MSESQWMLPSGASAANVTEDEQGDVWPWVLEHPTGRSRMIEVFILAGVNDDDPDPVIAEAALSQGRSLVDDLLETGGEEHVKRIVVMPDGVSLET